LSPRDLEGVTAGTRAFHIQDHLIFEDGFPAGWRLVLDSAAQRWQRVIRAPLPAVPLNDPVQDSVYRWRQFPTDIYLGP
jgi:hypothetical protein